jgi:hypothetical protein
MHAIRKLRESGHGTAEQFAALLADDVVMHSPLLIRAIIGREAVAKTMAASAQNRDNPGPMCWSESWTTARRSFVGRARSRDMSSRALSCLPMEQMAS